MGNLESQSYNALNLYNENNNNNCENNLREFNRSKSCSMQNLRTINNDVQARGIHILINYILLVF